MATSTASMPAYLLPGVTVCQPSHLEGDSELATEILPGPPPKDSVKQSIQKRDPRKPTTVYSYLPASDPGSTYSGIMHGTLVGQEVGGIAGKRPRNDKGTATGRAQRASARNQNGAATATEPPVSNEVGANPFVPPASADSDYSMIVDEEPSQLSRSNSSQNLLDSTSQSQSTNGRTTRRKDKGKGKEIETSVVRIKEEPKLFSLHTPEPLANQIANEDHCSACATHGPGLVYCDGCPKAFHPLCLDPPREGVEDEKWFCPACHKQPQSPPKDTPKDFLPLVNALQNTIPTEFALPDDIRTFFKDVSTAPKGSYVDHSEIKPPRLNRHGQLEDRDAHRLRDRSGQPVLCYRCGTSALPEGVAAAAPATKRARRSTAKAAQYEIWKNIISCDYCSLHWHLDCLDPPLSVMPSFTKKWMCPNHADQILTPKRRIPKHNAPPIEITKPKQFNNGNIEIIQPEMSSKTQTKPKVAVDEVLINGRRYRVPERIILLDFWNKVSKNPPPDVPKETELDSGMSSPLTELSSLDDMDDRIPPTPIDESEDLKVAHMLCGLRLGASTSSHPAIALNGSNRRMASTGVQTEEIKATTTRTPRVPKLAASAKRVTAKASASTRQPRASEIAVNAAGPSASVGKRKKSLSTMQPPEPSSTRELRSKNKSTDTLSTPVPSSSRRFDESETSISALPSASVGRTRGHRVKMEELENGLILSAVDGANPDSVSASTSKATPRRKATVRKPVPKEPEENGSKGGENKKEEKRGRKRKERDDEMPYVEGSTSQAKKEKKEKPTPSVKAGDKEKRKTVTRKRISTATPTHNAMDLSGTSAPTSGMSLTSTSFTTPGPPATPSLKIRLPRLNAQSPTKTTPVTAATSTTTNTDSTTTQL